MTPEEFFKICPCCFKKWTTREAFLSDHSLKLNGYKADFKDLEFGMFFFTHHIDGCHSTMALMVGDFRSLYSGEIYAEKKALSEECPRYCVNENQLSRCNAFCECAFVREIMHIIQMSQSAP